MPCRAPKRILRGPRRAPNTSYGEWGDPKTFDHILWKIGTSPCAIDANQCLMQANSVRLCRYGRDLQSFEAWTEKTHTNKLILSPSSGLHSPWGHRGVGAWKRLGHQGIRYQWPGEMEVSFMVACAALVIV